MEFYKMFKEPVGSQAKKIQDKKENKQTPKIKMADLSPNVAIITLNVNDLNTSLKRQILAKSIKTYDNSTQSMNIRNSFPI